MARFITREKSGVVVGDLGDFDLDWGGVVGSSSRSFPSLGRSSWASAASSGSAAISTLKFSRGLERRDGFFIIRLVMGASFGSANALAILGSAMARFITREKSGVVVGGVDLDWGGVVEGV